MIKIALPLVKYFKILNHNLVKSYLDKNLRKPGLACSELKHLLPNVDLVGLKNKLILADAVTCISKTVQNRGEYTHFQ